jgi:hypothetical protein
MSHRVRMFFELALVMAFVVPIAVAQKPAPPTQPSPPPNATGSGSPTTASPNSTQPNEPTEDPADLVMFLRGRVATSDGTAIPHDVMVERVCNAGVKQQVYAYTNGTFSMALGSRADSFLDASGDRTSQFSVTSNNSNLGIPRRELTACELRATVSGFYSDTISLAGLDVSERNVDVGVLVVRRTAKIEGNTVSATPYKAPKPAWKAYEKGLAAEKNGKLADARKDFETAVEIYPRYAHAWFELGKILQQENQKDGAREAYSQATSIDSKFLLPYQSLASMAFDAGNWPEVLTLTGHIVDVDPSSRTKIAGYILDTDQLNYTEIYFYNAVANYELNKSDEAEKSGLKAEQYLDVGTHFPQLHLLMAEIFAKKNNYATAASELQTYLELVPHAQNAKRVQARLAQLQALDASGSTNQ